MGNKLSPQSLLERSPWTSSQSLLERSPRLQDLGDFISNWAPTLETTSPLKQEHLLVTSKGHKIYVVSTSACDFVKIGYTGGTLIGGVWKSYRRAYGEDTIIHRIFPANRKLEDLEIHRRLLPKYGMPEKGNEIYHKRHLPQLIQELSDWHSHPGYGPYCKADLIRFRATSSGKTTSPRSDKSGSSSTKVTKSFSSAAITAREEGDAKMKSDLKVELPLNLVFDYCPTSEITLFLK